MTTKKSAAAQLLEDVVGGPLTLGALLHSIRETDELTQLEMAKRLGLSKSHLCDIEKGRKGVSPERAARFAEELGYGAEQFVRLALQQLIEDAGLNYEVRLAKVRATRRRTTGKTAA